MSAKSFTFTSEMKLVAVNEKSMSPDAIEVETNALAEELQQRGISAATFARQVADNNHVVKQGKLLLRLSQMNIFSEKETGDLANKLLPNDCSE